MWLIGCFHFLGPWDETCLKQRPDSTGTPDSKLSCHFFWNFLDRGPHHMIQFFHFFHFYWISGLLFRDWLFSVLFFMCCFFSEVLFFLRFFEFSLFCDFKCFYLITELSFFVSLFFLVVISLFLLFNLFLCPRHPCFHHTQLNRNQTIWLFESLMSADNSAIRRVIVCLDKLTLLKSSIFSRITLPTTLIRHSLTNSPSENGLPCLEIR